MKQNSWKRLLSLVLALAMVLGMLCQSMAVETEADTDSEVTVTDEAGSDALSFDDANVIHVDADEPFDPEELLEEEAEAPTEEKTPVEEEALAKSEADEVVTAETEETEEADEEEKDEETGENTEPSWAESAVNDGEPTFDYTLSFGEAAAKEGYYLLPELSDGYLTFEAGLYYIEENGIWHSNGTNGATDEPVTVTVMTKQDDAWKQEVKEGVCVSVGKTEVSSDENGVTVNPHSGLLTGTNQKTGLYYEDGVLVTGRGSNKKYYIKGVPYNGYYYNGELNKFYQMTDGVYQTFTGTIPADATVWIDLSGNKNDFASKTYSGLYISKGYIAEGRGANNQYYIKGLPYTGYYYNGELKKFYQMTNGVYKTFTGTIPTDATVWIDLSGSKNDYKSKTYSGCYIYKGYLVDGKGTDGKYYMDGKLYTGYYYNGETQKFYSVKKGVSELLTGKIPSDATVWIDLSGTKNNHKSKTYSGLYIYNGKILTGVSTDRYYYKNGVKQSIKDKTWLEVKSGNIYLVYYFKKDSKDGKVKAVTGWNVITRNKVKYKYYFRSTTEKNPCSAVTDMFAYNSAYKKKKLEIRVSRSTDTATILCWDSKSKAYIPCRSFPVSMASKQERTLPGKYNLRKKNSTWFTYVNPDTGKSTYFLYPTFIQGSGSLFHSSTYMTKGDHNSLKCSTYNNLGTKNTTAYCVRTQVKVSKLIYELVRTNKNITVYITKAKNVTQYMPYGNMTITYNFDYCGKLAGKYAFEPTDTHSSVKNKTVKLL